VRPTPFENPRLVSFNPEAALLIGLDPEEAHNHDFVEYFSGRKLLPGSEPLAMYYTGHQFGVYNPDIGDGRAILLGEVRNGQGRKYDLHLKGSGAHEIRARLRRQGGAQVGDQGVPSQ